MVTGAGDESLTHFRVVERMLEASSGNAGRVETRAHPEMTASAVSPKVEPMADLVNPYYATRLVDELERRIPGSAEARSAPPAPAASRAQATDVDHSVAGALEPPD
jgi:hypothetical protein